MTKVTRNELLDALREFGKAAARRPAGEGWMTVEEMAKAENLTMPAIRYKLTLARKRGVAIEQAFGTALDDEGRAKKATFYRIRNGKP